MFFQRTLCTSFRLSHFSKTKPFVKIVCNNSSRYVSTDPSSKSKGIFRYKYLIAGALGLTAGTVAYINLPERKETKSGESLVPEEFVAKKFIDDRLDEKLALLEEHGPVPYLLIGGGTASYSAFRAIRSKDPTSRIVILGEEPFYPYMRPPLSKELWDQEGSPDGHFMFKQWNGKERSLFYEQDDFYTPLEELFKSKNGGVSVIRGVKVVRIDPTEQIVYLDTGKSLRYDKCLLATGARPKSLPVFEDADDKVKKRVILFRGINDYEKLNFVLKKAKSVAIIGGGFLGSELACALGRKGADGSLKVTQVFPESGNMARVLPEYLCKWTTEKVRGQNVNVIPNVNIKSVCGEGNKLNLHLDNDEVVSADHAIVAVGVDARTELAEKSGLEIDDKHGGFLVNTELEARKNLWIAGDASCFYDTKLGRRRVEHHDHAVVSGRLAGENMTGKGKPYWHQSMFWSDLGPDVAYEGIGLVDSSLETVGVFAKAVPEKSEKTAEENTNQEVKIEESKAIKFENKEPRAPEAGDKYNKGIVFYMKKNTIVGIVLWNVFAKIPVARKIISEAKPYDDLAEVAKLFDLKSTDQSE